MIPWLKLQSDIATNAKIAKAGPDGALVYLSALCQHVKHGHGGRVPAHRLDPETLRIEAVSFVGRISPARIASAFARCIEVGLLRAAGEHVVIAGYDEEAMPSCVRCHNPNQDHRYATCPACRASRIKAIEESRDVATSPQDVATCRTGPDRTGQVQPPHPPQGGRGGASRRDRKRAPRAPETGNQAAPASRDRSADRPPAAPIGDGGATDASEVARYDPVIQLQHALMRSPYRSATTEFRRRIVLRHEAERLHATGLTPKHLEELIELAAGAGHDPGGLLAHWLDGEAWREVLDERASRDRALQAAARHPADQGPIAAMSLSFLPGLVRKEAR